MRMGSVWPMWRHGAHGTVTINKNKTALDPTDDYLVYTPEGLTGYDTCLYTLSDGNGETDFVCYDAFLYPLSDGNGGSLMASPSSALAAARGESRDRFDVDLWTGTPLRRRDRNIVYATGQWAMPHWNRPPNRRRDGRSQATRPHDGRFDVIQSRQTSAILLHILAMPPRCDLLANTRFRDTIASREELHRQLTIL